MARNQYGVERYSAGFLRRRPVSGPMLRRLFRWTSGLLILGIVVTVLLLLTTGNPLDGFPGSRPWRMALILSPYLGWFLGIWIFTGTSIWRGIVFLIGAFLITGYGFYRMADLWYLAPRPFDPQLLLIFPIKQWAALGAAIILAMVPGMLFGAVLERVIKKAGNTAAGSTAAAVVPDDGGRE